MENFFVRPKLQSSARLRLFCFHAAGSGASQFIPWAQLLPQEIELCGIQLPGRESRFREQPYCHIEPLLADLEESIYPLLDRPFAIFGLSLGGTIGFELARRLRQAYHIQPDHLFVASRRAPHLPERFPPIAHLPEEQFIAEIQKRYNGIPEVIRNDRDLLDLFLPTLRADFQVLESYQYLNQPPLDCPITAYAGTQDVVLTQEELEGWQEYTYRDFTHQFFSGGHFFFNGQPAMIVQAVMEKLWGKPYRHYN